MDTRYPDTRLDQPAAVAVAETPVSAVSWASIIAGAVVAASVSLILAALGSGLGFASLSPWSNEGVSATTFGVMTGVWFILMQWASAGVGAYLTGRLRTRWASLHTHEMFFRDTAHGFLTWALATVLTAGVLASSAAALVGGGVHAAATVAGGAAQGATMQGTAAAATSGGDPDRAYTVDTLFRTTDGTPASADVRQEAGRILAKGLTGGGIAPADRDYLAGLVAARTGVDQATAQQRVDAAVQAEQQAVAKAKEAADKARKAASGFSLFTALSMVIGAFIACIAAALGGRQRDEHA